MGFRPYISAVGAFAKFVTQVQSSSCTISGQERFLQLLADEARRADGRGVFTFANHISVMDDPGLWGCMPWSSYQSPFTTRWTLGATDIMFTNPIFSALFKRGQVISTDRGRGIFQPALDTAISKLEQGQWVHMFPEGYVNLSRKMVLRRFKWGLSRLLLESKHRPRVVPIWIEGFDQLMPDPRNFPKFLPRPFAKLHIHFGEPIDRLGSALDQALSDLRKSKALNPLWWSEEAAEIERITEITKQENSTRSNTLPLEDAPSIPIPKMSTFPPIDPITIPPNGWAPPPVDSLAAQSMQANALDHDACMQARSSLVELCRRELAHLGLRSRRERGLSKDGDPGDLVHTLIPRGRSQ